MEEPLNLITGTSASWAQRIGFSLSTEDVTLLGATFRVQNPRSLPNMREDIPIGSRIAEVEFAYEILAPSTRRDMWIRCCECGRNNNHRSGVVVRLDDGSRATVGRDCGSTKHSVDFESLITAFDEGKNRSRVMRQVLEMLEQLPLIQEYLKAIKEDKTLKALLQASAAMASGASAFCVKLACSTGGRIVATTRERDFGAEGVRDGRLDRKLDALARRIGMSRQDRDTDKVLYAQLLAEGDRDASKEPLLKNVEREIHRFAGHEFFSVLPDAQRRCSDRSRELVVAFQPLRDGQSSNFTTKKLEQIRATFLGVLEDSEELIQQIEAAVMFFDHQNFSRVVDVVSGLWRSEDSRRVILVDGVLRSEATGADIVDTRLPPLGLNVEPFRKARAVVEDARLFVEKAI